MNMHPILGKALRYDHTKTINITRPLTADDKENWSSESHLPPSQESGFVRIRAASGQVRLA